MTGTDAYLDKSPDAGRMGMAAEYLVAAVCILATRGRLNVSTSIVDDEGVDLVFHLRDSTATLAVQVKSRMMHGVVSGEVAFRRRCGGAPSAPVRTSTCSSSSSTT